MREGLAPECGPRGCHLFMTHKGHINRHQRQPYLPLRVCKSSSRVHHWPLTTAVRATVGTEPSGKGEPRLEGLLAPLPTERKALGWLPPLLGPQGPASFHGPWSPRGRGSFCTGDGQGAGQGVHSLPRRMPSGSSSVAGNVTERITLERGSDTCHVQVLCAFLGML